ncbi:MAG: alpha/beta hydrolase [Spirochaetota bacterium]
MTSPQRPSPHRGQPIERKGPAPSEAAGAMLMIHGRGASADDILGLADEFEEFGLHFVAPQASDHTWYPHRFLAPIKQNEPYLSSALSVIDTILAGLVEEGVSYERVFLLGFSQGACLSLEYVARNPRRYGGVFGLSGGLIGPEGDLPEHSGDLAGTPVFLGCSDVDFHIPKTRVQESSEQFRGMNAEVTERLYPGMAHTVAQDEIDIIRRIIAAALG